MMTVVVRRIRKRLRSKRDLLKRTNGHGKGKWHGVRTLWAYKQLTKRRRKIAEASRRQNRRA